MAENDDATTGPGEPAEAATPAPADATAEQTVVTGQPVAAAPAAPAGPRFTERVWNFRAMVAVALAALLLGGGIGSAIAAVSHDDGPDRRPGLMRFEDVPPGFGPGQDLSPEQRRRFREDLKDMRKEMRERMKDFEGNGPAPSTPSPSATPNG